MEKKARRWIFLPIITGIWFLIADAYWMSKERVVTKCVLDNATELYKHGITPDIYDAKAIFWAECSWVAGGGNYWNSPSGMAYWELILLTPVIHRYRFDF